MNGVRTSTSTHEHNPSSKMNPTQQTDDNSNPRKRLRVADEEPTWPTLYAFRIILGHENLELCITQLGVQSTRNNNAFQTRVMSQSMQNNNTFQACVMLQGLACGLLIWNGVMYFQISCSCHNAVAAFRLSCSCLKFIRNNYSNILCEHIPVAIFYCAIYTPLFLNSRKIWSHF